MAYELPHARAFGRRSIVARRQQGAPLQRGGLPFAQRGTLGEREAGLAWVALCACLNGRGGVA